jgi:hypothetical protein
LIGHPRSDQHRTPAGGQSPTGAIPNFLLRSG